MSGHPGEPGAMKLPRQKAELSKAWHTVTEAMVPMQGRFPAGSATQLAIGTLGHAVNALLAGKMSGRGEMRCRLLAIG
jgi:hypothetical protein